MTATLGDARSFGSTTAFDDAMAAELGLVGHTSSGAV